MNIFLAGIHGVGKTFLAEQLPTNIGLVHTSASKLIREELAQPNWGTDKRVGDVDVNQIALAQAVKRHNENGEHLLLDGHFVLLDSEGQYVSLKVDVFKNLNLNGVILLQAEPDVVVERIRQRDNREISEDSIKQFSDLEHCNAQLVCAELGIDLILLNAASTIDLLNAIQTQLN